MLLTKREAVEELIEYRVQSQLGEAAEARERLVRHYDERIARLEAALDAWGIRERAASFAVSTSAPREYVGSAEAEEVRLARHALARAQFPMTEDAGQLGDLERAVGQLTEPLAVELHGD